MLKVFHADLWWPIAVVAAAALVLLSVSAGLARALRVRPTRILTPAEWRLYGKGLLLAALALLLLERAIHAELPPQIFLYGRF